MTESRPPRANVLTALRRRRCPRCRAEETRGPYRFYFFPGDGREPWFGGLVRLIDDGPAGRLWALNEAHAAQIVDWLAKDRGAAPLQGGLWVRSVGAHLPAWARAPEAREAALAAAQRLADAATAPQRGGA